MARGSVIAAQKSTKEPIVKFSKIAVTIVTSLLNKNLSQLILKNLQILRNVNLNILKFLESINNFCLSLSKIGLKVSYQLSVIS